MPANIKWQNVDFLKSDAYDWLERQLGNVMVATKEALEGLRVMGNDDGTLKMPKKFNQLLSISEQVSVGDGETTGYYYLAKFKPIKKAGATLTYIVSGTEYSTTDDGSGAFSEAGVLTGTINYDTGEISLTFNTAPDDGTAIVLKYSCDVETAWNTLKGDLAGVFVVLRQLVTNGDNLNDPV